MKSIWSNYIKHLIFLFISIVSFTGCNSSYSTLDKTLEILGTNKFNKGSSVTGGGSGFSWFTFDGKDLKVEYTIQANTSLEQVILKSGNVYRDIEENTINDLHESGQYIPETEEVVLKLVGDWGSRYFESTLDYVKKGDYVNSTIKESKIDQYVISFFVKWNDNSYAYYCRPLNKNELKSLRDIYIINDKENPLFSESIEKYNCKIGREEEEDTYWITQDFSEGREWKSFKNNFEIGSDSYYLITPFTKENTHSIRSVSCGYEHVLFDKSELLKFKYENKTYGLNDIKIKLIDYLQQEVRNVSITEYINLYKICKSDYGSTSNVQGSLSEDGIDLMYIHNKLNLNNRLEKMMEYKNQFTKDLRHVLSFNKRKNSDKVEASIFTNTGAYGETKHFNLNEIRKDLGKLRGNDDKTTIYTKMNYVNSPDDFETLKRTRNGYVRGVDYGFKPRSNMYLAIKILEFFDKVVIESDGFDFNKHSILIGLDSSEDKNLNPIIFYNKKFDPNSSSFDENKLQQQLSQEAMVLKKKYPN